MTRKHTVVKRAERKLVVVDRGGKWTIRRHPLHQLLQRHARIDMAMYDLVQGINTNAFPCPAAAGAVAPIYFDLDENAVQYAELRVRAVGDDSEQPL